MNVERLAQACHLELGETWKWLSSMYRQFLRKRILSADSSYMHTYQKHPRVYQKPLDILVPVPSMSIPNLLAKSRVTSARLLLVSPRQSQSLLSVLSQTCSLVYSSVTADMALNYNSSFILLMPQQTVNYPRPKSHPIHPRILAPGTVPAGCTRYRLSRMLNEQHKSLWFSEKAAWEHIMLDSWTNSAYVLSFVHFMFIQISLKHVFS